MYRENFNDGWIFWSKEKPESRKQVRLPFDAMQTEERIPKLKNGPLVAEYPGGDYYYEKHIRGSEKYSNKSLILEFGGVFMHSHVYLNGEEVGGHIYGYTRFFVDITDKLLIGEDNVLLVYVNNSQTPNSRWYSGSGIYRPVYLLVGDKEHIVPDGIKAITREYDPAVIEITVETTGTKETEVHTELLWENKLVAESWGNKTVIQIPDAHLWDAEHPNLYTLRVSLIKKEHVIDTIEQHYGIRKLEWNATEGFKINGNSIKLRGVCVHHDNGVLGAAEYREAELRKVRRLKAGGFNAIRGAHDPRSLEFLEVCDELGMYVLEEAFDTWYGSTGSYGYALYFTEEWRKDLEMMIRKSCNHPSVIMYSIGNEIAETATEKGVALAQKMTSVCHKLDDSRPVTMGINLLLNYVTGNGNTYSGLSEEICKKDDIVDPKRCEPDSKQNGSVMVNEMIAHLDSIMIEANKPENSDPVTKDIYNVLDIAGYNYGEDSYEKHHEMYPERVILGTETNPSHIGNRISTVLKNSGIIGDFYWTGWEYLGECGIGIIDYNENTGFYNKPYPAIAAGCGLYDLTGHRDTTAYDLAIAWKIYNKPHLAVSHPKHASDIMIPAMDRRTDAIDSWSFSGYEGITTNVRIASPGKSVELLINGISLGTKDLNEMIAEFQVEYEPGTLEAIAYDEEGIEIGRDSLKSAGSETKITVSTEKEYLNAGNDDIMYLDISLTDDQGIVKPIEEKIHVQVSGAAELLAVGSAAHRTEEKYTGDTFTTYNGRMIAVLRAVKETGMVHVLITCGDMETEFTTKSVGGNHNE